MSSKGPRTSITLADQAGYYFEVGTTMIRRFAAAAIGGYQSLLTVDRESQTRYYRERGIAHARKGRYYQAQGPLESAYKALPSDTELIYYLGVTLLKTDQTEDGIALLEKGLQLDPAATKLASALGMAYIQKKDYKKAAEALEKATKDPDATYNALYRLGIAYDNLKKYDKALAAFNAAREKKPDEANVYQSLGFAYEQSGDHATAVQYFKKALELEEMARNK
jgi:tetratricopeptide (TPR) repeat protein